MGDVPFVPTSGRIARATGTASDIQKIATELAGTEFRATIHGECLFLKYPSIDHGSTQVAAEWTASEIVRLIAACAALRP